MNTYLLYPRLLKWGFVSLILLYLDIPLLYAQDHTLDVDDILEIPISKDNGQEIVSASKKSERLFESPLSASVITAEDMKKAGCTSIQQALRLFAGMIVREQSAGNFEFHIRGMDYLTPPSNYLLGTNNTTLVMETEDEFIPEVDLPRYLEQDPRCQEWEDLMGEFQEPVPAAKPGEKWSMMEQVFKL